MQRKDESHIYRTTKTLYLRNVADHSEGGRMAAVRSEGHTQTSDLIKSWKSKNPSNKRQKNKTQGTKRPETPDGQMRKRDTDSRTDKQRETRTSSALKMHFFLLRFLKHFRPQTQAGDVTSVRPRWRIRSLPNNGNTSFPFYTLKIFLVANFSLFLCWNLEMKKKNWTYLNAEQEQR